MQITIDLGTVPPSAGLTGADDFTAFSVAAARPSHTWVHPDALRSMAGERADDPDWAAGLAKMVAYAESKGWVREDGAIRAHIEWTD
jgi:hypothetical protein